MTTGNPNAKYGTKHRTPEGDHAIHYLQEQIQSDLR